MQTLIDHLVYGAPDLPAAVDDLDHRLGVRAQPGGKHAGLGTHNALLSLGGATYLEVIAPDPEQPAPTRHPFGLGDLGPARLAGWAVSCRDIDAAVARARAGGYDPGDPIDMQRMGPSGEVLRWRLTVNALDGGPVPFLIEWGDCEHPAGSAPQGLTLERFEIEHPDPDDLAPLLAALDVDVTVRRAGRAELAARLRGPKGATELR